MSYNIKKQSLIFFIFIFLSSITYSYIETDLIKFNTIANPVHEEGLIFWDNDAHTQAIYNDFSETTQQVNYELVMRVRNKEGKQINNGQAVYIDGGTAHLPDVKLAIANDTHKKQVVGLATMNISNNQEGLITITGAIHYIDTSAFNDNDTIYLSHTEYGEITNTIPPIPYYTKPLGIVTNVHLTEGVIYVMKDISNGQIVEDNIYVRENLSGQNFNFYSEPFSLSDTLFEISGTQSVPQFVIQNGGPNQASLIVRSFLVVNQNNTLLNQSQNNLCSDWGFDHLDCNTSTTGADFGVTDDIEAKGIIYADSGLRAHTTQYGAYLALKDKGYLYSGTNGTYTASNQYFCDYTFNSFNETDGWIVITTIGSIYNSALANLAVYINSSCYQLTDNPSWINDITTPMSWKVIADPELIVADDGLMKYYVGDKPQSKFEIDIDNGTGIVGMHINDRAGTNQHRAVIIDSDSKDFDGVIGQNIYMYSSTGVDSIQSAAIKLEGDATGFNNSHLRFIDVALLGQGNNNDVDIIHIEGNGVNHIIHKGSSDTISKGYVESVDQTINFTTLGPGATLFENDNDYIYIGSKVNFTSIGIALSTTSSKNLLLEYHYCNNNGVWNTLSGITDTTNGMLISGTIVFNNPNDRGSCNIEFDGTPFTNTTNYTYIAIKRTLNNNAVDPIESLISISGSETTFLLTEDMLKLNPVSAPPEICDANYKGGFYVDTELNLPCFCTGTNWVQMDDFSSICS